MSAQGLAYWQERASIADEEHRLVSEESERRLRLLKDALDWMERTMGGDSSLTAERYYATRDAIRVEIERAGGD